MRKQLLIGVSLVAAVFLVLSCTIFMNGFFLNGVVDMSPYFSVLPFLLIMALSVLLITYVPDLSLGILKLLGRI